MFIAHKFTREIFIYLIFIILAYFLGIIQIENVFDTSTRNYILNFMGSDNPNSNIETIVDESSKILSILEGEMSPLFYLLSYNLILGLLILLHIIIILIILGYKYEYIPVRRVFSYIINRFLSKKENLLKKFEVIRNKIEIFGGIYLNVLLKININPTISYLIVLRIKILNIHIASLIVNKLTLNII